MKCGHLPQNQLAPSEEQTAGWGYVGGALTPDQIAVCPGYACALPQVIEVAEAWGHWNKNQVDIMWPKPLTPMQRRLLDAFASEQAAVDDAERKERADGTG